MLLKIIKKYIFLFLFSIWLTILFTLLLGMSKHDSFIMINHHRGFFLDLLMTFFTEVGSGLILIPIILYLLFKKQYYPIIGLLVILAINSLLVSWLKHLFYEPRPILCYGKKVVQSAHWMVICQRYSFPSGHTALVFAIAAYISYIYKKKYIQISCFMMAFLIGYSRIYLGQHFVLDVCFGSILGVFVASCYYLFTKIYTNYRFRKDTMLHLQLYDRIPL